MNRATKKTNTGTYDADYPNSDYQHQGQRIYRRFFHVILIIIFLLLSSGIFAADKTPYNIAGAGNAVYGTNHYHVTWMAENYDLLYNIGGYPRLGDSIMDTINSWGTPKMFKWGPYASPHEINQYEGDSTVSDASRNANTTDHWLYIYAKEYLVDSLSISVETLVVHIADDMASLQQLSSPVGYRQRRVNFDSLALSGPTRRFTYQYWDNQEGSFTWPMGMVWLVNSKNSDARKSVAYAYRKKLIEDSANYGSGKYHYRMAYADNYSRSTSAPRQPSYYTIDSTRGGSSTYLDWIEQDSIGTTAGCTEYYDYGQLPLLGELDSMFVAEADANSFPDTLIIFANVDKYNSAALGVIIKQTSVHFETIFPWNGSGWNQWKNILDNQDTLRGRNDDLGAERRYAIWECRLDASNNEGAWNTLDRLTYEGYAWFLWGQSNNQYYHPTRFNDTTRFRNIYRVDLGSPIESTRDTTLLRGECSAYGYADSTFWCGATEYFTRAEAEAACAPSAIDSATIRGCQYLWSCKYLNGADTAIVLFVSGRASEAGQLTDTFAIYLGGNYYKIDVNGDTSLTSIDTAYISPCGGWIGVQSGGAGPASGKGVRGRVRK